ncbi:MAG: MFS transporter [Simkaniaceae bacterium]
MRNTNLLKSWLTCISAALFFTYELIQMHMLNAISPMVMKDLQLNASFFSYLCAAYLFADVVFLIPAGIILDRCSTRKTILWALGFCVIGTFGFGLAQNFLQAFTAHFLSGIGNAFCFLSCMLLVSRWFPLKKQAFVVGIVVTIGLLGGMIAQAPFIWLAQTFTWRQALFIDGFLGIVLFFLIFLTVRDYPEGSSREAAPKRLFFSEIKQCLKNKQNFFAGIFTGLMNLPLMLLGAMWGTLFCHQIHHMTMAQAASISSMICLGTIIGSPIFGRLSDGLQQRKSFMLAGNILSLILFLYILYFAYPISAFRLSSLFFLLGFFSSSQIIGYPVITESNPKHLTGTSMGIAAVIIMGLAAIAQPLSGILMHHQWNGAQTEGLPIYSLKNFQMGLLIIPIGFILSLFAVLSLKETKKLEKANKLKPITN